MGNKWISVAAIASLLSVGNARADWMPIAPDGYQAFLTYMGNGEWNPAQPNPVLQNCTNGVCLDDYFGRVVQGRTPQEEQLVAAEALEYFNWRFGIDMQNPAIASSVLFAPFTLDTRLDYRAYVISGLVTPTEGFKVRDGGWVVVLLTELTLGGEFAGRTYPAGTLLIFGENNIKVDLPGRAFDEEIVFSYRFANPVTPDLNGNVAATIELHADGLLENDFGSQSVKEQGLAQLTIGLPKILSNGLIKSKLRTVLTFSKKGGY